MVQESIESRFPTGSSCRPYASLGENQAYGECIDLSEDIGRELGWTRSMTAVRGSNRKTWEREKKLAE